MDSLCFLFVAIIFTEREGIGKKGDRQEGGGKKPKGWCNSKSYVVKRKRKEEGRKKPFLIMKYCHQFEKNWVLEPKKEKSGQIQ